MPQYQMRENEWERERENARSKKPNYNNKVTKKNKKKTKKLISKTFVALHKFAAESDQMRERVGTKKIKPVI